MKLTPYHILGAGALQQSYSSELQDYQRKLDDEALRITRLVKQVKPVTYDAAV